MSLSCPDQQDQPDWVTLFALPGSLDADLHYFANLPEGEARQIAVAERVLAGQGIGARPVSGSRG